MDGRCIDPEVLLQARYLLPVLPGFRVMLPADLLWVLDFGEGDELALDSLLRFYGVSLSDLEALLQEAQGGGRREGSGRSDIFARHGQTHPVRDR